MNKCKIYLQKQPMNNLDKELQPMNNYLTKVIEVVKNFRHRICSDWNAEQILLQ
jgi:hypothetical protein